MAALTLTAKQLFARWGCIPVARGDLEGVSGAIGGKKASTYWAQTQEQTFWPLFFTAHLGTDTQGP